jgi:hypothetical protein
MAVSTKNKAGQEICFLCDCHGVETVLDDPYMTIWLHEPGGSVDCWAVRLCRSCWEESLHRPEELSPPEDCRRCNN